VRTTNYIERLFREARRRTRLVGVSAANKASCDRMLYGLFERLQRNRSRRPLTALAQASWHYPLRADRISAMHQQNVMPPPDATPVGI